MTPATPNGAEDSLATVSHKGANAKNVADFDPKSVFNRLFTGTTTTTTTTDQATKLANVRKSVLDVGVDGRGEPAEEARGGRQAAARTAPHLHSRHRAAAHDDADRHDAADDVHQPDRADDGKDTNSEAPAAVNSAMADLSMLALACDRTRVLTFVFSLPAAHVYYRYLGTNMNADFHDTICHGDAGDSRTSRGSTRACITSMTCLNEFLTKMQSTAHGASNLLDQSLVFVTSDTAWGKTHTNTEWPVLLAGKAGGKLQGDGHYNFPGDNLSKALLTVSQIMGSTATSLGSGAGAVTAPLTASA